MDELAEIRKRRMMELKKKIIGKKEPLDKPVELTDETVDDLIKQDTLVVVDCWAPWCAPCMRIAPVIEKLAKQYSGKIIFGKLDVDKAPRTAARYGIMSIPTLLVFKKGTTVDRITGALPKQVIESKITQHLKQDD